MQVFSEPEISQNESSADVSSPRSVSRVSFELGESEINETFLLQASPKSGPMNRRDSYEVSQIGDNTYATILPRNLGHSVANSEANGTYRGSRTAAASSNGEIADYATLRNVSRAPSTVKAHFDSDIFYFKHQLQLFEFTGSTFQAMAPNDDENYVDGVM